MKDFIEGLSSPWWWFSVVVVGILLNLGTSYLRDQLDALASRLSRGWRERSEANRLYYEAVLQTAVGDLQYLAILSHREMRDTLRELMTFLIFTAVAILFVVARLVDLPEGMQIVLLAMLAILLFAAFLGAKQAVRTKSLVDDAVRRYEQGNYAGLVEAAERVKAARRWWASKPAQR